MNCKKQRPPRWADSFLEWYCTPQFLEEIQGDLHEAFYRRCNEKGIGIAKFLFITDVLSSVSLRIIKNPFYSKTKAGDMIKNYLIISYRNLLRSKLFSIVNILGLAIGMAACFLIVQYASFEFSYDKFHNDYERIYRVTIQRENPSSTTLISAAHPGVGPAMKEEFPEVQQFTRLLHQSIFAGQVTAWSFVDNQGNEKVFNEERVYCADTSFLSMFSFPMIYGNPETALRDPNAVVISESVYRKFFGSEDPIGKTLIHDGGRNLKVTGVFKDIPENSHIKFDILVSYFFQERLAGLSDEGYWKWAEYYTYIKLVPGIDPSVVEARLDDFVERHMGDFMRRMNYVEHFHLQPLADIHLRSPSMIKEREIHGSEQTVFFLLIIAAMILIIAWVNYVNLSTSKSAERSQEVGIRKVVGATRKLLITQFLLESAIVNFLALALAFAIVTISLPYFNDFAGKSIGNTVFELTLLQEPLFWLVLASTFIVGSIVAGLYPAYVLSSIKVTSVLKGKFFGSKSGILLRKTLVASQFIISVVLIAGTIIVFRQVSFMRNQKLGYAKDQVLAIKSPRVRDSITFARMETFKVELKRHPSVNHVTPSNEIPGRQAVHSNFIRNYDDATDDQFLCYWYFINPEFFKTFDVGVVAGQIFDQEESLRNLDKKTPFPIMLNRKASHLLRFKQADNAVNKLIHFGFGGNDYVGEIIGVVKDYHQRSLRDDYDPIIFFPGGPRYSGEYIGINMSMKDPSLTVSFIEEKYEELFPGNQFQYFFLDEFFNRQYASDQQFGKVFGLFSGLALFVASLGLFGLSTFVISQRTKEIAVRKVLGATLISIVALFSKDFVRLIIIANLIALPVVYYLADRWLDSFAFHINLGSLIFIIPIIILLIISLATVSFQTIKTGLTNPVKSLRSE